MDETASHPQPSIATSDPAQRNSIAKVNPAWGLILALAVVKIAVHLYWHADYGYFRDELYYLDCAEHLDWGYVDHPPLSILVLAATKAILGTSLIAIRLPVALAGAATVVLIGLLTWRIGGGRFAQALASLTLLIAPVYLGIGSFFSMYAFDQLFWTLAVYALVRAVTTGDPRFWLWFGVVAGVGLLNKISMAFLGFGVVAGLVLTPHRQFFATKELWLGGLIALLVFSPHLIWQIYNGLPTLEFIENVTRYKIAGKSVLEYYLDQIGPMHPANAPIWIAGIVYGLLGERVRTLRILSVMFLAVFALLALRGMEIYYLSPAFPPVLALGAVWIERTSATRRWVRPVVTGGLGLFGAAVAPLPLPWLAPAKHLQLTRALGITPPAEEYGDVGAPLPQILSDRFGWPEMVDMVAQAYNALEPADREHCAILCCNYGEAGAINFFGPAHGLPRAISGHKSYFLWGPQGATGEVMLVYWYDSGRAGLEDLFESVTEVGHFEHPYVMPYENNRTLLLCRGLKIPMEEFWRLIKPFI